MLTSSTCCKIFGQISAYKVHNLFAERPMTDCGAIALISAIAPVYIVKKNLLNNIRVQPLPNLLLNIKLELSYAHISFLLEIYNASAPPKTEDDP